MPTSLGPAEILVILVVALIVLGPKRLPEAGRQVGKALAEVRRWSQDMKYEMNQAFNEPPAPTVPSQPAAATVDPEPPPTVIDVTATPAPAPPPLANPDPDPPQELDAAAKPAEADPAVTPVTPSEAPPEARG